MAKMRSSEFMLIFVIGAFLLVSVQAEVSCLFHPCPSGYVCKMIQPYCFVPPCLPVPTCVPIYKPGRCPYPYPWIYYNGYGQHCYHDYQCPGNQKCCYTGFWGKRCTNPTWGFTF